MPDYLGLLRELAALEPPLFVFGSVAEAALLDGELSQAHGDLDVLIPRSEFEWRMSQLAALGFGAFAVRYEPRPGLPLVYGTVRGDLELELSLVDFDSGGNPFFVVRTDAVARAISMPADLFQWPPTLIDGIPVYTLSPLALVHLRAGALVTRAFGPERFGKDDIQQARMIETFFGEADATRLQPAVTPIEDGG